MRWQGGRRGGGIEDRRGMGGGAMAGGGLGVLVLAAIGYFVFGIDPSTTQQVASQFGGVGSQERGPVGSPQDQAGQFVEVIRTNINDVWATKLARLSRKRASVSGVVIGSSAPPRPSPRWPRIDDHRVSGFSRDHE